jgi:chromosomal replication initiator protein
LVSRQDVNLFNDILGKARAADPVNTRKWFDELVLVKFDGGLLEIGAPDEAKAGYLSENCGLLFTRIAQQATGHLVTVKFSTQNGHRVEVRPEQAEQPLKLHPDYNFENFVVGPGNRLCHASCVAVSNSPGTAYNPLFLYGSVGLGKTHLLHAICWEARKNDPSVSIQMLSCEKFMNLFIRAIEVGSLDEFQTQLRSADILIIDDIQFLREREQSQEEFFHTFNALYDKRKQIVLTADCAPGEIKSLEERLVSRFKWGLVASIDAPSYETRIAIVQKKANLRGLDITEEIAEYIASRVQANIRELEGALTSVYAMAKMLNEPISIEIAKQALGERITAARKQVAITDIINAVTNYYNVRKADLQSKKRSQSIAVPRQMCMYLARTLTGLSLEEIGGHLGGRDHTTVMHACSKIAELEKGDEKTASEVGELTKALNAV